MGNGSRVMMMSRWLSYGIIVVHLGDAHRRDIIAPRFKCGKQLMGIHIEHDAYYSMTCVYIIYVWCCILGHIK